MIFSCTKSKPFFQLLCLYMYICMYVGACVRTCVRSSVRVCTYVHTYVGIERQKKLVYYTVFSLWKCGLPVELCKTRLTNNNCCRKKSCLSMTFQTECLKMLDTAFPVSDIFCRLQPLLTSRIYIGFGTVSLELFDSNSIMHPIAVLVWQRHCSNLLLLILWGVIIVANMWG